MALVGKISTVALGSVTVAGASAYYSYSTSINEKIKDDNNLEVSDKKVESPKRERVVVDWTKAKRKSGYKTCLKNFKSATVCGWVYNGLRGVEKV